MTAVDGEEYQGHRVFLELEAYSNFYRTLSESMSLWMTPGIKGLNFDTYVYSSMQGTLDSIRMVLQAGRINDAYALLRKFHDSATINIYAGLYLADNFSLENFIVDKIEKWLNGKESLPEYRVISEYIKKSVKLKPYTDVLFLDARYTEIRDRCNDHTHYNFYEHVMLNDNEVYVKDRVRWLGRLADDAHDLFIYHTALVFALNDNYMMASDYRDALECGMQPEQGSEYWVDPFIQETFNTIISPRRPDVAAVIKSLSSMQLD